MYNPPTQYGRRLNITYPRGRLLHYLVLGLKFSGFHDTKTSVNKRLYMYSLFYTVEPSAPLFTLSEPAVYPILSSVGSLKSRSISSIEGSEERRSLGSIFPSS